MGRCDSAAVSVTQRRAGEGWGCWGTRRPGLELNKRESAAMTTSSCTEGSSQADSRGEEKHHGTPHPIGSIHSSSWACCLPEAKPGLIPSPPRLSSYTCFQLCSSHMGPPELHVHSTPSLEAKPLPGLCPMLRRPTDTLHCHPADIIALPAPADATCQGWIMCPSSTHLGPAFTLLACLKM